jgi:hypothetical protein
MIKGYRLLGKLIAKDCQNYYIFGNLLLRENWTFQPRGPMDHYAWVFYFLFWNLTKFDFSFSKRLHHFQIMEIWNYLGYFGINHFFLYFWKLVCPKNNNMNLHIFFRNSKNSFYLKPLLSQTLYFTY